MHKYKIYIKKDTSLESLSIHDTGDGKLALTRPLDTQSSVFQFSVL